MYSEYDNMRILGPTLWYGSSDDASMVAWRMEGLCVTKLHGSYCSGKC